MAYFNYHAKTKNLIKTGHCVKAEIVENHNGISPALVLYFDDHVPMPIRLHTFNEYIELLKHYDVTIEGKAF